MPLFKELDTPYRSALRDAWENWLNYGFSMKDNEDFLVENYIRWLTTREMLTILEDVYEVDLSPRYP